VSGFFGSQYYYDTWIVVAYGLLLLLLFISSCQKSVRIAKLWQLARGLSS